MDVQEENKTDQSNQLPEGWEWKKIAEISKTTSGGTPKRSSPNFYNGDIPWIKSGDLNNGFLSQAEEFISEEGLNGSSAKLFQPNTILIAMYGATIGKLSILAVSAATNQAICGIALHEGYQPKYLFYYLMLIRRQLIEQGKGGAQPNINQQIIRDTLIPVPSLEQQKQIVAKIEELFSHIDAGTENLKIAKDKLKQYRQSVLKAAVTGELTKDWREQNADQIEPADQLLQRILKERRQRWEQQQLAQFKAKGKPPKNDKWKEKYKKPVLSETCVNYLNGWVELDLSTIASAQSGFAFKSKYFSNSGSFQVIKMANVKNFKLDLQNRPAFLEDVNQDVIEKYLLINGDILITLTGTRNKRDYGYVVQISDQKNLLLNQRVARLRPFLKDVSDFLVLLLTGDEFRNEFFSHETGNVGQGNVGMKAITETRVKLPSITEQRKIVRIVEEKLTAADRLMTEIDIKLTQAQQQKQTILASAFKGELV